MARRRSEVWTVIGNRLKPSRDIVDPDRPQSSRIQSITEGQGFLDLGELGSFIPLGISFSAKRSLIDVARSMLE